MIKKVIATLVVAMALPVIASAQKFGIVDAQSILQAMPEFTAMQAQLNEASKKYEEEYKKLQEEIDKKYQEFQALAADTPDSIKERRMQEIQDLGQKLDNFRQMASQDMQRQQQNLMTPIEQKLLDAIKTVGQEGNFTFIFQDGSAPYVGTDVVNVTDRVKAIAIK